MSDIELYDQSASLYEELQERRPDYPLARKVFFDLVTTHFKPDVKLSVADFCCGTGNNSLLLSKHFLLDKVTLIDINRDFLEQAKASGIQARDVVTIESDILKANIGSEHDLVISMFAYHHVPDGDKARYIEVAKKSLKKGGVLMLGEIYMPDRATTLKYYDVLIEETPEQLRTTEYKKFLKQTAASDHFEYKVSMTFAHDQLQKAGFSLSPNDCVMIWPKDKRFGSDVGMFVEAWRL